MKYIKKSIYLFAIIYLLKLILLPSCANNASPLSGGPKDTIPPKLVKSYPLSKSVNYKDKDFSFYFDEVIDLVNLKKELIVSPHIESKYKSTLKRKSFSIKFEDDFQDSTTYTLYFRNSIVDVTEKNPSTDNTFSFSTGEFIDSLMIKGNVIDLFKNDSLKNVLVGLYKVEDSNDTLNKIPYYFTETTEKGFFKMENIKEGKYFIHAIKDENSNLILESQEEMYGFIKDTIEIKDTTLSVDIFLIKQDITPFKLLNARNFGKYFNINFSKEIKEYSIETEEDFTLFYNKTDEDKSLVLYNTLDINNLNQDDSIKIFITAFDTIQQEVKDTLLLKFPESKRSKEEFHQQLIVEKEITLPNISAKMSFNKPILNFKTDSILFLFDSIAVGTLKKKTTNGIKKKTLFSFNILINTSKMDSIKIDKEKKSKEKLEEEEKSNNALSNTDTTVNVNDTLPPPTNILDNADTLLQKTESRTKEDNLIKRREKQEKEKQENKEELLFSGLQLYIPENSFISVEKDSSKTELSNHSILTDEKYGILKGKIITDKNIHSIQLLTGENIVKQTKDKEYIFNHLLPGKYKMRILIDNNNNGKHDMGNILKREEPEEVIHFPQEIIIRENWELINEDLSF